MRGPGMTHLFLFIAGSLFLLRVSWRALKNPGVHGFYRFFVFEAILGLVLLNQPYWFVAPFSAGHILSWILLAISIVYITQSLRMLKHHGGQQDRAEMPENLPFENTVQVVDAGIYRYVRHPMYASLLFLGWGAYCKHLTLLNSVLVVLMTAFLVAAARVEEKENIDFFGPEYSAYIKRSKMFIPWLL